MKRFYVHSPLLRCCVLSGEVRNLQILNQVYQVCITNSLH